jgi:hypothetical protein
VGGGNVPRALKEEWFIDKPRQSSDFKEKHCYKYPFKHRDGEKVVFYLINLRAPSKSGYLVESKNSQWRHPTTTSDCEQAYTIAVHEDDISEVTIRKSTLLPGYYHLVILPFSLCERWQGNTAATKDEPKYRGQIQYF